MKRFLIPFILISIIVIHILFLIKITYFPYPELFIYSYLKNIGLLPYKQILDQHFPGIMLTPINMINLGLGTPQKARLLQFLLIIINHLLLYKVSLLFTKNRFHALTVNILYLMWQPFYEGYVLWIDSIIPMFLLSSFILLKNLETKYSIKKMFTAGLLLGIALVFKQILLPIIVTVGLFILFSRRNFKEFTVYLIGASIFPIILLFYIINLGVLKDFIFWTVTFNLGTFAQMGRKLPDFMDLVKVTPVFGLAFTYLTYKLIKTKFNRNYLLLYIFYTTSLLFAYARFDYVHLQPALVFAVLVILIFVLDYPKIAILALPLYLFIYIFFMKPFTIYNWGKPNPFFGSYEAELSSKVLKLTNPGSTTFAYGTTLHLYYLTKTHPPGNIFVFQFPWFMKEAHEKVLDGLIRDNPRVVVRENNVTISGIPILKYSEDINNFINDNYKIIDHVNETEILIKK